MPNAKKLAAQARGEDRSVKPRATRMFTDREDLRGAYHALAERALGEGFEDVYVIDYYGVGGAGKSMLLRKLQEEVAQRAAQDPDRRHITLMLDFDTVRPDQVTALEHLKAQLQRQGFRFPLFELALYTLCEKSGRVMTGQERADFFARNPEVDILADMVDMIPGVGIVTNLIRNTVKLGGRLKDRARELVEGHKRTLYEIEKMDESALLRALPLLFAEDVNGQLKDSDELHVFIDTYEKLVSQAEGKRGERTAPGNDQWLYGREGLVRNLGNAVFAIGGREKLHWAARSEFWEDRVESHLTAHLSEADSGLFLSSCGVPERLLPALYALTGGEPVFLDLCVDRYLDLAETGRTPEPEDFGRDVETLVERHTRYLPENLLDAAYLLGGMRRWNGAMFDRAARAAGIRVNPSEYREKLLGLSYVTDEGGGVCSMHQVIANILASRLPQDLAAKASKALAEMALAVLDGPDGAKGPDQTLTLEAAVSLAGERARTRALAWAAESQAWADEARLRFSPAMQWRQMAADIYRAVLGPEHPDTLEALGNLAVSCLDKGEYGRGRDLAEQVYEARARILGPEHPDTLASLDTLAGAWQDLGDPDRARTLYEKAYESCLRVLGPEDPMTLRALAGRAYALGELGDYDGALALAEQVYEARRRILGEEHPDTLEALGNLAVSSLDKGDYDRARALTEQVYEARARILGPEHPETLTTLGNLAVALGKLGDHDRALALAEQVYEARARILGPEHPDTLLSLVNLAGCWNDLGDQAKARDLMERAYEASARVLGPEHPDTLSYLETLAVDCGRTGDGARERALMEKLYEVKSRVLGPEHPKTLRTLGGLAKVCLEQGDCDKARALMEKAYEASARALGPEHPDTLMALGNLAVAMGKQGELDRALALMEQVYEARARILGPEHPDTLSSLENLADIRFWLGEPDRARDLAEQVYRTRARVQGPDHPDTLRAMESLAAYAYELEDYASAREMQEKLYEARERVQGPEDPETLDALEGLAGICADMEDTARALALFEQLYETRNRVQGPEDPDTLYALEELERLRETAAETEE